MIYKSDIVLLLVSVGALAAGLWNWQQNIDAQRRARVTTSVAAPVLREADRALDQGAVTPESDTVATATIDLPLGNEAGLQPTPRSEGISNATDTDTGSITDSATGLATSSAIDSSSGSDDTGSAVGLAADEPLLQSQASDGEFELENTGFGVHRVVNGDYLSRLAIRYGTSVEELQRINELDGTVIYVGQELLYPE